MEAALLGLNGVFAVLKPAGETSAKTVERVKNIIITSLLKGYEKEAVANAKKRLAKRIKVGHGGTLDPMATGVLVIGLNNGCKTLQNYLKGSKKYTAIAHLGVSYDTLDTTGKLLNRDEAIMTRFGGNKELVDLLTTVKEKFIGPKVMQQPPLFSAIHVNGVRAYKLARNQPEGTSESIPDLPARPVQINSIVVFEPAQSALDHYPLQFGLEVECGGGCYIRSLIRDMAGEIGSVAAMSSLDRVQQGVFTKEMAFYGDLRELEDLDLVKEAIERAKKLTIGM